MNKTCNTCKTSKPLDEMVKNNRLKCGYSSICKKCLNSKPRNQEQTDRTRLRTKTYKLNNKDKIQTLNEAYRIANKQKIREYQKAYRIANKQKLCEYKEQWNKNNLDYQKDYNKSYYLSNRQHLMTQSKNYRLLNRAKINLYYSNRRKSDSLFKLRHSISNNILKAFKRNGFSKTSKTEEIVGCTFLELKTYLESKFESWMNWNNYGLYSGEFDFGWDIDHIIPTSSASSKEELLSLNHHANLQPLCSKINRCIKKDSRQEQHLQL